MALRLANDFQSIETVYFIHFRFQILSSFASIPQSPFRLDRLVALAISGLDRPGVGPDPLLRPGHCGRRRAVRQLVWLALGLEV